MDFGHRTLTIPEAAAYLAGMIDGEGHVTNGDRGNRAVWVVNTDPEILAATGECCDVLGITWSVSWRPAGRGRRKPCGVLRISSRRNLELLARHVHLRAPHKRAQLALHLATYKGDAQSKGILSMEDARAIRERYARGETQVDLAREFGVHKNTVWLICGGRTWKEEAECRS